MINAAVSENSVALFTRAAQMLAEADTIQKAKELKDLAIVAGDWAKRKGMGEEAIKYARSYAMDAERRMGELLAETERQSPGEHWEKKRSPDVTVTPSLADLGITKRESSQAQVLAALPQETYEAVKTGEKTLTQVHKERKEARLEEARKELAQKGQGFAPDARWKVDVGDICTFVPQGRFDFIITDPPYGREYLELYGLLAEKAHDWLTPGGLVLVMCGQSYLNQIMAMMSAHLDYYWTGAYLTLGQPTPLRHRQVNTTWKPILIYTLPDCEYKGKIFGDVWRSTGNEKQYHKWGQSVSGMLSIIEQVCLPGQSIFDPFCGAGTTGIAALKRGCIFCGIDISEQSVNIARARLAEEGNDEKTL